MKFQPIKMHTDFTTKLGGKTAQLTDGARALGTAVIKRLDAWLLAWAHPPPAGFMSVYLWPGWMGLTVMPPAPSAGTRPLLDPAATPLVRAHPEEPPARHRTFGRRAALRPPTLRPSRLRGRRAPLETVLVQILLGVCFCRARGFAAFKPPAPKTRKNRRLCGCPFGCGLQAGVPPRQRQTPLPIQDLGTDLE